MSEWQPVETAPKSGRVLVFTPNTIRDDDPIRYRIVDAQFIRIMKEVTHWMPLVEPPK